MKKFKVLYEERQSQWIEVEANTSEEAFIKVSEMASDGDIDYSGLDFCEWSLGEVKEITEGEQQ